MGIGKELMNDLTDLAKDFKMEKIMLTVFKGCVSISFYASGHKN